MFRGRCIDWSLLGFVAYTCLSPPVQLQCIQQGFVVFLVALAMVRVDTMWSYRFVCSLARVLRRNEVGTEEQQQNHKQQVSETEIPVDYTTYDI